MSCRIPGRWRAAALAVPSLVVLLLTPLIAQARDPIIPNKRGMQNEHGFQDIATTSVTVQSPIYGNSEQNNGMPVRRVQPDEDRMKELSGRVVELNGQTLYVERGGAVVPLDLSAVQLRKTPEKGQEVVAVYQVENKVENVTLALAGEVKE